MTKHPYLVLIIVLFSFISHAQIEFEPGYFVNNSGETINCLIRNRDWQYNPDRFSYRLAETSNVEVGTLENVQEFGILNDFKYVRTTVQIDRSSKNINHLTETKNPEFKEEVLFLKVLVEGNASLFAYQESYLNRFFYKTAAIPLEQLVYKRYKTSKSVENENKLAREQLKNNRGITENNWFKQQLWSNLKCEDFTRKRMERLVYSKSSLVKLFTAYNECGGHSFTKYKKQGKKDWFKLAIRPGVNSSSLSIGNDVAQSRSDIDFGNQVGFRLGLEFEVIMPFNKNKWGIIMEPTYQYFKSEATTITSSVSGGVINTNFDYKSIEVPIGLRHYFFLNDNSKIFVNASYLFDFEFDSSVEFSRADGSEFDIPLAIDRKPHLTFGLGFKAMDRYSLEFRYEGNRNLLNKYVFWDSDYTTASLIFGYTLF